MIKYKLQTTFVNGHLCYAEIRRTAVCDPWSLSVWSRFEYLIVVRQTDHDNTVMAVALTRPV